MLAPTFLLSVEWVVHRVLTHVCGVGKRVFFSEFVREKRKGSSEYEDLTFGSIINTIINRCFFFRVSNVSRVYSRVDSTLFLRNRSPFGVIFFNSLGLSRRYSVVLSDCRMASEIQGQYFGGTSKSCQPHTARGTAIPHID